MQNSGQEISLDHIILQRKSGFRFQGAIYSIIKYKSSIIPFLKDSQVVLKGQSIELAVHAGIH